MIAFKTKSIFDAVEICRKVMFYLIILFSWPKKDMTSSVTWSERFECFSLFLKYIFVVNWQVLLFFSTIIYTVLSLSNYYSIFKDRGRKQKQSQKFKICVNWPILQVKIEKETYFWDFCKSLFQLNCLFAEINVQRLLIKENFKS